MPGRPDNGPIQSSGQLWQDEEGIWRCEGTPLPVSYPDDAADLCFGVEDQSFWFEHRNQCIVHTVRRYCPSGPVVDLGGGNGKVAAALQSAGMDVALIEPDARAAGNARRRGVTNVVVGTLNSVRLAPNSLQSVGIFDVLEHIPDEIGFLKEIGRALAPGGWLFVTVPAYQWLWSSEDEYAGHQRRYTLGSLTSVLARAGLAVEYSSYLFGFVPFAALLRRALPYRIGIRRSPKPGDMRSEHTLPRGPAGVALKWLLAREARLVQRAQRVPFGGSCLAAARIAV